VRSRRFLVRGQKLGRLRMRKERLHGTEAAGGVGRGPSAGGSEEDDDARRAPSARTGNRRRTTGPTTAQGVSSEGRRVWSTAGATNLPETSNRRPTTGRRPGVDSRASADLVSTTEATSGMPPELWCRPLRRR
jgi:hypothetical protein